MVFVIAVTITFWILKDFRFTILVMHETFQMVETTIVFVIVTFFENVQKFVLTENLMQNSSFLGFDGRNEFVSIIKRSFMERMMRTEMRSIFLFTQYRMHPHISDIVSREFYDGRLIDHHSVFNRSDNNVFEQFLQNGKTKM